MSFIETDLTTTLQVTAVRAVTRMIMKTIVREALESVGLHPDGAIIGAIGAGVAVIGKVNGYSWRSSLVIVVGGFTLCGYLLPAVSENWPIQKGTLYFLLFVSGFTSSHIYKFLDNNVPVLLSLVFNFVSKRFKK